MLPRYRLKQGRVVFSWRKQEVVRDRSSDHLEQQHLIEPVPLQAKNTAAQPLFTATSLEAVTKIAIETLGLESVWSRSQILDAVRDLQTGCPHLNSLHRLLISFLFRSQESCLRLSPCNSDLGESFSEDGGCYQYEFFLKLTEQVRRNLAFRLAACLESDYLGMVQRCRELQRNETLVAEAEFLKITVTNNSLSLAPADVMIDDPVLLHRLLPTLICSRAHLSERAFDDLVGSKVEASWEVFFDYRWLLENYFSPAERELFRLDSGFVLLLRGLRATRDVDVFVHNPTASVALERRVNSVFYWGEAQRQVPNDVAMVGVRWPLEWSKWPSRYPQIFSAPNIETVSLDPSCFEYFAGVKVCCYRAFIAERFNRQGAYKNLGAYADLIMLAKLYDHSIVLPPVPVVGPAKRGSACFPALAYSDFLDNMQWLIRSKWQAVLDTFEIEQIIKEYGGHVAAPELKECV